MKRQLNGYALLLRGSKVSEINKKIVLLSPEYGLLSAFAYGALKNGSRFSGRTELFSLVMVDLYYSPTKDFYTLRDIEVVDSFSGIRNAVYRFLAASGWAELIIRTEALGEPEKLFKLTVNALRLLEGSNEKLMILLYIQYLLRTLAFGGLFPNLNSCEKCGTIFTIKDSQFLDTVLGCSFCSHCVYKTMPLLTAKTRIYIEETMKTRLLDSFKLNYVPDDPEKLLVNIMELVREQLAVRIHSFELYSGSAIL